MAVKKRPESVRRQAMKPGQVVLGMSAALVVAGIAGVAGMMCQKSDSKTPVGAERLLDDISSGEMVAVHGDEVYLSSENDRTVYLLTMSGKKSIAFRLPSDVSYRDVAPTDDGLSIVTWKAVTISGNYDATVRSTQKLPFLGDFLQAPPRAGEHRIWHNDLISRGRLQIWRYKWGTNSLQPVPVPDRILPRIGTSFIEGGTAASGIYFVEGNTNRWAEVINSKGLRNEYQGGGTLMRLPLAGGAFETIATGLTNENLHAVDDAVCWEAPRLYPKSKPDTVCRVSGSKTARFPDFYVSWMAGMVSWHGNFWLTQPPASGTPFYNITEKASHLQQRLAGRDSSDFIEPPLRRSEADALRIEWVRRKGDFLYVLCAVKFAAAVEDAVQTPRSAPSSEGDSATEHPDGLFYMMRLNPARVGHPDFWGKPVAIPDGAKNFILDNGYVYFTRTEVNQTLGSTMRDLFSSAGPTLTMQTPLYRLAIP